MTPIDLARTTYRLHVQRERAYGLCCMQIPWDHLGALEQECYVDMVMIYLTETVDSPETLHALWMQEKLKQGWRPTQITRVNSLKKEHGYLVPWDSLNDPAKFQFADVFTLCKELGCWLS